MKEIGAMLKAAREEKGLTLDEIQMLTKIRYKQLEAMEAGDFHKLPGEVYVKGFIGNYAKNVGLDAEGILAKYYELKKQAATEEPDIGVAEGTGEPVKEGRVKAESPPGAKMPRQKPNLLVMAGIGVVLGAVVFLWMVRGQKPAHIPASDAPLVMAEDETKAKGWATEEPVPSPMGHTEQTVEEQTNILIVEASEVVWLGIYRQASSELIFEGTLYPEERREWILTEDVMLRIGNAGGVKVIYQGQDLGELGYSGQVISKVLAVD